MVEPLGSDLDDADFAARVAAHLAEVPGVVAVALGGSRAAGTGRPGSDWDFGVYYRPGFDPDDIRALGWEGEVFGIGAWGGGVMNGGAWLRVGGRKVDLHWRDLAEVRAQVEAAERGQFRIERLPFHLAGVPTYLVVGELAGNRVLVGALPRPAFPPALRRSAVRQWGTSAAMTLRYARDQLAPGADVVGCAGAMARATLEAAHAVLAARGEWALNEKGLVRRAGLVHVTEAFADLVPDPARLDRALGRVEEGMSEVLRP